MLVARLFIGSLAYSEGVGELCIPNLPESYPKPKWFLNYLASAYALKLENVKNTMKWPSYVGAMQRNTNKNNTNYHVLQHQLL